MEWPGSDSRSSARRGPARPGARRFTALESAAVRRCRRGPGIILSSKAIRSIGAALAAFAGVALAAGRGAPPAAIGTWEPASVTVAGAKESGAPGTFSIRVAGATRTFELALASNDRLLRRLADDERADLAAQGVRIAHGGIPGSANSWARVARVGGHWAGAVFDGRELWLFDPVERVAGMLAGPTGAGTRTVLYRAADARLPGPIDPPLKSGLANLAAQDVARTKGGAPDRELELAVWADPRYGEIHGPDGMAFALARLNVVDGIFSAQLGVRIVMSRYALITDGTWPVHSFGDILLGRFAEFVNGPPAQPKGDLNHLLTGRDICLWDGMGNCVPGSQATAGIATAIGRLCHPTDAYALSEAYANTQVLVLITAHELGHQFGAPHDGEQGSACEFQPLDNWLMKAAIDGNDSTFSPCSLNQVSDDIAAAACLRVLETPLFADGFEG
jgi:hypothetical protein